VALNIIGHNSCLFSSFAYLTVGNTELALTLYELSELALSDEVALKLIGHGPYFDSSPVFAPGTVTGTTSGSTSGRANSKKMVVS
jgi:hypothetical protein